MKKKTSGALAKSLDLKLPVIKDYTALPKRALSMDEYLRFVEFNWKYTVNKSAYRKQKKIIAVDVPFKL